MVADQQSSASPRPRFTVGYALPPGKAGSVIQPPLEALAAERGMRLVAVDASLPLADQGPFDLIIHKLFDRPWRAQLEAFSALHPAVPVVDAPAAVDRLLDRFTMLDVVPGLAAGLDYPLSVPAQVTVSDAAALAADDPSHGLRFPLIAKPLAVDGSASSHDLCLVYRAEGLRGLHTPVVLQEFVNHGGVLFKVYVVGDRAVCVRRSSLPDVPAERLVDPDADADASVPFANISNRPADAGLLDKGEDSMPPAAFVDQVARGLRQALGLHLLNFDMFAATELDDGGRRRYFLVDINYFPGFAKMPGYETALTDFFAQMIQLGTGATSLEKPESVPCNGLDLEETGSTLDSTCHVPMV